MDIKRYNEKARSAFMLYFAKPTAAIFYVAGRLLGFIGKERISIQLILTSIRFGDLACSTSYLLNRKSKVSLSLNSLLSSPTSESDALSRSIILSSPKVENGVVIKGVILLTYSHTFSYWLKSQSFEKFNKLFLFVLEPSSSGYADPDILEFADKAEHCVIQATEITDRVLLNMLYPSVPCLDTGASNWVDFRQFDQDNRSDKVYDCIYVANGNPVKRVYRLVDAINDVVKKIPSYRALIICANWGGGVEGLRPYVESKGLIQNIEVRSGMPQSDLIDLVNQSKASVLCSLKEGSNRVLFESMFANVPVICLAENKGVNKGYINSFTGLLVKDHCLADALIYMSSEYDNYNPRAWAMDHISPFQTISELCKIIDLNFGKVVNNKLATKVNGPEVKYWDFHYEMKALNEDILRIVENNELIEEMATRCQEKLSFISDN